MGFLDEKEDAEHYKRINRRLKKRGMVIYLDEEWEIHGPHPGMNYQVYVGYARYENQEVYRCVAMYPWATYEIDDEDRWWYMNPDRRIYIKGV